MIHIPLWNDQRGAVLSTELVLLASLVVVSVVSAVGQLRNAMHQELGDIARMVNQIQPGEPGFPVVHDSARAEEHACILLDESGDFRE